MNLIKMNINKMHNSFYIYKGDDYIVHGKVGNEICDAYQQ